MLTGESYPITVPKDDVLFDFEVHKRHILLNGTQLLQGRPQGNNTFLKAVIIRTGFMTSKGKLIRAILFPKPINFRFYVDLVKVAGLFLIAGLGGMIYSMYTWTINGGTIKQIILHSLDLLTYIVPPTLPAALTATTAFAQRRLLTKKIFCLNAKHISLCGGVDIACFDKTGTLTETDIDLAGAIPIQKAEFQNPVLQLSKLPDIHPLLQVTTTCHTLIKVNDQLNGYSIDRKMFDATQWNFANGPPGVNSDYGVETPFLVSSPLRNRKQVEYGILKRFPFESSIKRMTVIAQRKGNEHYNVYMKGAPEIIAKLCDPVTVPSNYYEVLKHYTTQGYRVIALAAKTMNPQITWTRIQKMTRNEVEANLELTGLLVMRNQLKKETIPAIRILKEAHIGTVMVTGDNLPQITVPSISKSFTTIPFQMRKTQDIHNGDYCFSMDGTSFELLRIHDPELLDKCIHRCKVFARMAPEYKQHLIEALQKMGHQVAMVGDGCNDCGALRTADAGISLSMADASVAAPFTSQETNISCVVPLISEGRTTLDSAFGTFLFAIAICFIGYVGTLMLYSISTIPSDFQYLILTWSITIIPFFIMGNTDPHIYLHPRRPLRHLLAFLPLFSFFTFLIWQTTIMLIAWFYCRAQPFVFEAGKSPPNACYEETAIFHLICIGSIVAAVVFSPSEPYSRSSSNKIFMAWLFQAIVVTLCTMFITNEGFVNWCNFKPPPHPEYTVVILALGVFGGLFCFCWEKYLIRGWMYHWAWPRINRVRRPRHLYQKIEKELKSKPDWPKINDKDFDDLEQKSSQVGNFSPNVPITCGSLPNEDQIVSLNSGDYPNLDSQNEVTLFKTFHGSQRGDYTGNGTELDTDNHENIPLTESTANVEDTPSIRHLDPTTDEESEYDLIPPTLPLPAEFFIEQSSPVQSFIHQSNSSC